MKMDADKDFVLQLGKVRTFYLPIVLCATYIVRSNRELHFQTVKIVDSNCSYYVHISTQ